MYQNNKWHYVCFNGWDDIDAGVVCRQLGFGSVGKALHTRYAYTGLGNLMCSGNESRLLDCNNHGIVSGNCWHYYRHYNKAWVICGM